MSINSFFLAIFACLILIYVSFKPLEIKKHEHGEIPLFELSSFTMHELTLDGLVTVMSGAEAVRFKDRYLVENINYTDNSKKNRASMEATHGVYHEKDEILYLDENIIYTREDGLSFKTQNLNYYKKTSIAMTDSNYTMKKNSDEIRGSSLVYNNTQETILSKNIVVKYQLKEEK